MKNVPLGDIATLVRGVSFSKEEGSLLPLEGHLPVIRAGSIQASLLLREGQVWVPADKIKSTQKIRVDDIVMCTSSGSSDLVGKCARSTEDFDGSFGAFCAGIRADQEKASPSYLYHFLCSPVFKNWTSASSGANIKNIRVSELAEFQVPLPPLPEQKRIAAILDKADTIRRKRQQAIQLADDFLRAVFLDMFGDPNSNPKNTDVLPMTEVFDIRTGKLNSNAAIEGGKYPFFTCAKEVFAIDEYAFDQEALLLAGNNAQADYDVKHYKGRFNAYQRTYVLTLRDSAWSYPFYKFALQYQLSNLKYASKGSSTKYITMEIMGRTMLPVPSQEDQKRFVKHFDRVVNVQAALLVQAQNDEGLFSALSNRAFSGQL